MAYIHDAYFIVKGLQKITELAYFHLNILTFVHYQEENTELLSE